MSAFSIRLPANIVSITDSLQRLRRANADFIRLMEAGFIIQTSARRRDKNI